MKEPSKHAVEAAQDFLYWKPDQENIIAARIQSAIDAETEELLSNAVKLKQWVEASTPDAAAQFKELGELRAQCAAMREALEKVYGFGRSAHGTPDLTFDELAGMVNECCEEALKSNAGRNCVPIEDVKPLLEALRTWAPPDSRAELVAFLSKHGDKLK